MNRIRLPLFTRSASGSIGSAIFLSLLCVAIFGPFLSPYSIGETVGAPGSGPSPEYLLGTDYLGRDVLSRLLNGGLTIFLYSGAATALSFGAALVVGMVAGYSRSWVDSLLMRSADVLLAFPSLLVLLVLTAGAGPSVLVLIVGVALVQLPGLARLIRTSTLEVVNKGYVEVAVARGDSQASILWRDVMPNIANVLLADLSLRFGYSIILVASMNYLGLGLPPPTADWGLMVSENRQIIELNLASVLAPAIVLALVTISVNLMVDSYFKTSGAVPHRRQQRRGMLRASKAGTNPRIATKGASR